MPASLSTFWWIICSNGWVRWPDLVTVESPTKSMRGSFAVSVCRGSVLHDIVDGARWGFATKDTYRLLPEAAILSLKKQKRSDRMYSSTELLPLCSDHGRYWRWYSLSSSFFWVRWYLPLMFMIQVWDIVPVHTRLFPFPMYLINSQRYATSAIISRDQRKKRGSYRNFLWVGGRNYVTRMLSILSSLAISYSESSNTVILRIWRSRFHLPNFSLIGTAMIYQ